jgi:hypothetical protein
VAEYAAITKYPIFSTPGLIINEKVVCVGRIPNEAEITSWLTDAAMQEA